MKKWLKQKLIVWLELDRLHAVQQIHGQRLDGHDRAVAAENRVAIDASVGHRDSSWIVIATPLNGGQVRILECPPTDLKELAEITKRIVGECGGIRRDRFVVDAPYKMSPVIKKEMDL